MSTESPFLRKAQLELKELLESSNARALSDMEAYRALVLAARLRDAPPGQKGAPSDVPVTNLLASCELPTAQDVIDDLAVALEGDDDPHGPLLDVLLDIDDLAGVLAFADKAIEARRLVVSAKSLVTRNANRVSPLAQWAAMRRQSLSPDASIFALWDDISEQTAASAVILKPRIRRTYSLSLPQLPSMAAHSIRDDEYEIQNEVGKTIAIAYVDQQTGERKIDITLDSADEPLPAAIWLVAKRSSTLEQIGTESLQFTQEGRDLYVSLGPDVGPKSARHRLCQRLGVDVNEVFFEVRIDGEP